ncbi:hypothetical protein Cni_G05858 [Canna indica]|uniref:Mur ligase N-terminal catalytic domain-containing protein n=1 Tax=Canna indica TaxID=4628 RepID=A0AAQ3Q5E7_9LILI|nr:hypothetical protein Cni_G05858 [Canna indica]
MESRALPSISSAGLPPTSRPKKGSPERSPCVVLSCRNRGRAALRCRQWGSLQRRDDGSAAFGCHDEKLVEKKQEWIHFVGIGGTGLSALAMLALKQGFEVSGSDITWNCYMDNLHKAGARLFIGHSVSNIHKKTGFDLPNALVISSAIPADNEEIAHAMSIGVPIFKRALWLKKITEKYNLIAISGTHVFRKYSSRQRSKLCARG